MRNNIIGNKISTKTKYLIVIPARGGSKRIKNKNLVLLAGKPLISYTIESALSLKNKYKIIVSTDEKNIADYALALGAEIPFMRPAEFAKDISSQLDVLNHALEWFEHEGHFFDALILLQPTSPFRKANHIDEAIDLFEKMDADTLTSVCQAKEHPYYMWKIEGEELQPFITLDHQKIIRQDLPPIFVENGAIYIIKKAIIQSGKFYGEKIIPYIMDSESSIDIDLYEDLYYAEFILKYKLKRNK